jgi:ATPase subunit of ABC transporter with duplicated ATPase domains
VGEGGAIGSPAALVSAVEDAVRSFGVELTEQYLPPAVLLARFDVLCLDEPTNDLDFAGLERLERFVDGFRGSLVVVSHDRAFLDRTVRRVLAFDAETRRVREFAGSYASYEHGRELAARGEAEAYARWVEEHERFKRAFDSGRLAPRGRDTSSHDLLS